MSRLIKRYGSRKLYDTSESRYVSLDEVSGFVRDGQTIQVVDNRSGDDVTAAILTQIISEEGRAGNSALSPGFLHDLLRVGEQAIRIGESAVEAGLQQARRNVDQIARRTVDRIRPAGPLTDVRDEMVRLRARLESLESTLDALEPPAAGGPADAAPATSTTAKSTAAKATAAKSTAAKASASKATTARTTSTNGSR